MADYNYIAVEGVIGAGKTTLAKKLADHLEAGFLGEKFEDNPFLPKFYRDPRSHAFTTQIFFLLSRYRQLSTLHNYDLFHEKVVTDYIFEKDKIFAYVNLSESELRLYEEVEENLAPKLPSPELVIYLQTSAHSLLRRIRKRGRDYEKRITEEYISRLVEAYEYFFYRYESSPLLVINSDRLDLTSAKVFRELALRLERPVRGTEYYNPDITLWG